MNSNLPILYRNIMDGLPNAFAQEVFLWASDKFTDDTMLYRAEAFARKAASVAQTLHTLIQARQWVTFQRGGLLLEPGQETDLLRFFQARHANYRIGGNVKTSMPEYHA